MIYIYTFEDLKWYKNDLKITIENSCPRCILVDIQWRYFDVGLAYPLVLLGLMTSKIYMELGCVQL